MASTDAESKAAAGGAASPSAGAAPTKDMMTQVTELLEWIDKILIKYPFAQQLQDKTKIRPAFFAVGAVTLVLMFVLFGFGAAAVCSLTGFVYPLYASFKALKSEAKDDDTMWLTYWIVYAFFSAVESFTDFFLRWIPFYYVFKVAFLIWCFLPQTRGAGVMYNKFIFPIFIKAEGHIAEIDAAKAAVAVAPGGAIPAGGKKIE